MVEIKNLTIYQGSDTNDVSFRPDEIDTTLTDLTDYTAQMQIRPYVYSDVIYDDLTTTESRITIEQVTVEEETYWQVTIHFPNAVTTLYDFVTGVYDLELISTTDEITRILQGTVYVNREVTRGS